MNSAVRTEIRARMAQPIDLKAITGEQAVYAVLDRALLWEERENSWWGIVWRGFVYVWLPVCVISGFLWYLRAPLAAIITPIVFGATLLFALWLRLILTLAREGVEARIVASMSRMMRPPANADGPPTVELPELTP